MSTRSAFLLIGVGVQKAKEGATYVTPSLKGLDSPTKRRTRCTPFGAHLRSASFVLENVEFLRETAAEATLLYLFILQVKRSPAIFPAGLRYVSFLLSCSFIPSSCKKHV